MLVRNLTQGGLLAKGVTGKKIVLPPLKVVELDDKSGNTIEVRLLSNINVDDTITQGHSTLDRDVLQTVWGKTRANILDQIFELKDIYYEMIESFNNIFMGLY